MMDLKSVGELASFDGFCSEKNELQFLVPPLMYEYMHIDTLK